MNWFKHAIVVSFLLAVALAACSSGPTSTGTGADGSEQTGEVSMRFTAPDGITINQISYAIKGPTSAIGTVDISQADSSIEFVVGGLKAGDGYSIVLTATDTAGDHCSSQPVTFGIRTLQTTQVVVNLVCLVGDGGFVVADAGTGSVEIDAGVTIEPNPTTTCPTIASYSISPAEAIVGAPIQVGVETLPLGAPVTYTITPTDPNKSGAGTIKPVAGGPKGGSASVFVCTSPGQVRLTATVSAPNPAFVNPCPPQSMSALINCEPPATPPFVPPGPTPLPAPPGNVGCYVGTTNGWVLVPCIDPTKILTGFQSFDVSAEGLGTASSGGTQPPIVFGQIEATVESIGNEQNFTPIGCTGGNNCADGTACPAPAGKPGTCPCDAMTCSTTCDTNGFCQTGNQWGIQLNSNWFPCPASTMGGGTCWAQFVLSTDGVNGDTAVCIETWQNGTTHWNDQNFCVGANGQQEIAGGGLDFEASTRIGPLQAGDFANVAAFAYTSGGNALLGMVAQYSWVSNQDAVASSETALPNRIPGLYAIVTPDQYDLAHQWTNIGGSFMGMDNSATSTFSNAEVLETFAISDCQGDVSASGPTCSATTLTSSNVTVQFDGTSAETNNLSNVVGSPGVSFPNQNLAVTEVFATTSGACLAGQSNHLFMKDNNGDNGGVPSNVGNVPFWESPDIFVMPNPSTAPGVNDTPGDLELTAGSQYDVYLRVHNDFGCSPVQGPVNVFIDAADPNLGFANWLAVTPGADTGMYTTFGTSSTTIAPAFGAGIIGPFTFTPMAPGGHKCLLAAIAAGSETEPPASGSAPVLPPAYSNNQIAQRNLQIGDACSYSITNSTMNSANLTLGISVTPSTPPPNGSNGETISLTFGDPSSAFFHAYHGLAGLASVTQAGSGSGLTTTIALGTSYISLPAVSLGPSQSPSVSIFINPPSTGPLPTVDVSAFLTDPKTGDILQANGGSCQSTQIIIP